MVRKGKTIFIISINKTKEWGAMDHNSHDIYSGKRELMLVTEMADRNPTLSEYHERDFFRE